MDINKVELSLGQKIANPFKTTRKSDTNPFEYKNFEGNTLQFADVFEGFNSKEVNFKGNKLKMISSSVMGSLTKLHNSITEPIVNFVNRIRTGITHAWDYAAHTNITDVAGIRNIKDGILGIKDYGKNITDYLSGIGSKISDKMSFLNKDVTEIGHDLSDKWTSLISGINTSKIPSGLTVAEYKALWIKENELLASQLPAKEIALNPSQVAKEITLTNTTKEMVA